MLCDLHVHTKASDGLYTPQEVCHLAIAAGLGAIAITDHDTLNGVIGLKTPAGLDVMPGVEISTIWEEQDIHILGYNVSPGEGFLHDKLIYFQNERKRRLKQMVVKLQNLGYKIDENEAAAFAEGESVGRPHIARALVAKGYFGTVKEVFEELLQAGAPAYVPREKVTPLEGIQAITSGGGFPVLAHPGLTENSLELIGNLAPLGLKGVEVFYPLHTREFINDLLKVLKVYGLLATGGSDFHGYPEDAIGKTGVDVSVMDKIRAATAESAITGLTCTTGLTRTTGLTCTTG